jgi:hypothetical protein
VHGRWHCEGLAEEPVAPSDHKGPYCAPDPVGVERDLRMFEERQKLAPLTQSKARSRHGRLHGDLENK